MDKEKDPEEDSKNIDQKYSKTLESIKEELPKWIECGDDKVKIDKHFEDIFTRYKELRDYIANYSYSIPAYSQQHYQAALDALNE